MPWVQVQDFTVNPGGSISCGAQTINNQFFAVRFPDLPVGARQYFGTIWLRSDQTYPDLTTVAENMSKSVWHNSTIFQTGALTVNGFVFFRLRGAYPQPTRVKTYRFV